MICNLPPPSIANGESEAAKVLRAMYDGLRAEGLKPIEAFTSAKMEPVTLYEVIGEGALRMIVLNPEKGSKELTSLANALKTDENIEKHAAATSLALLLVWHPADHTKPVTRILITGSCPLEKLYAALEKLKGEDYLRVPEFTHASKEKPHGNVVNSRLSMGNHLTKTTLRKAPSANGPAPRIPATRAAPVQNKAPVNEAPLKKVVK
ncbi:unnamed protein product [Gongylonema pulchrum]|uniref:Microtubule-associated protein 1A/B/S-like MBL-like domain-containing protein n=1 Tax=Gongylonema pulchrum TaxID=637853 RepID=A0A3P7NJE0_9BILA|nr:unnamed protein product [Gongylonema pulchrum]